MSRGRWRCVAWVLWAAGCTPYVVKDDIVGPHGEQLIELSCWAPDTCMSFAREVCRGDFDVATNDYNTGSNQTLPSDIMLVHCKNTPAPPGAVVSVAPDAGP
jgi:hypothetical protein